jgi:hypothetical protein
LVAKITPSATERGAGEFTNATLEKASQCMRTDGTLILEDIVEPALIREARETFVQRYDRYLDGREHDDALQVGNRRLMITVDLEPPFERRELIANPWLWPILSAAFQGEFEDGGDIFPQAGLNRLLPTFAVTVGIPLLEMNENHGTTALWPGSHRDEARASADNGIEPRVREGSCVVWDYRLRHGGTANRSPVPRPLLYMTYCRPWFLDHKNYRRQAPLRAPKRTLANLPEDLCRLLIRALEH